MEPPWRTFKLLLFLWPHAVLTLHSVPSHSTCTTSFFHQGQQPAKDEGAQGAPAKPACPGSQRVAGADVDLVLGPREHTGGCLSKYWWRGKAQLETQRRQSEDGREDPWGSWGQRSWPFPVVWEDWGPFHVSKFIAGPGVWPLLTLCHIPVAPGLDTGAGERWANRERRGWNQHE